ncbi:S8 family serine peptidase [Actinophytocola xanthii]|uniref:S8 family serine peptidase n=1 Tax=Actinophytocola xanthii TaxID=1912961 RepID=UPI0009F9EE05|nr:S8 family serine peptidase [Actinophytocola xanthii]
MLTAAACLLAVVGLASPAVAAPPDEDSKASQAMENAARQIGALQDLKKAATSTEAKVDSKLLVELKARSNRAATAALPRLQNGVEVSGNKTLVDIRATVSDDLLKALTTSGATLKSVSTRYGTVRAELPLSAIARTAARADVRKVEVADGAMTARQLNPDAKPAAPESKEAKRARIEKNTRAALADRAGPVNSAGDRTHNADSVRRDIGVTGVGVKICALSDGIDSLGTSQAAGELPAVDVLPTQAGAGDEGTAMLEIIHDVAPTAELGFATAFNGDASFADNIRALRFELDCDIIVDDIIYFKEAPFQDWIIAQAVNDVIADGALYFSSAGNEGNVVDGTAGHWEGDYVNSGQVIGKFAGYAHDFDPSANTQVLQPISDASSAGVPVLLNWSDPIGRSGNDYDLYMLDAAGNVLAASQDYQTGTQDAYERVNTPVFGGTGLRLAVVKFAGADRYLSLTALRGRFSDSADGLKAFNTPGVTFGHSAARGAYSVAAAPADEPLPFDLEPGDPPNPSGPYPDAFNEDSAVERFTSDGPRRVFYEADGTPITPGNVSSTGGEVRQKPDITAADGVMTSVDGFDPFFGTSAAAPHAAAIAGLVLSGNPGIDPAEVREALTSTAIDIVEEGVDGRSGHGVVLADRVLDYTGASPQPLAQARGPKIRPSDGGQYIDPGDTVAVELPVTNVGDATAVSTSVVLTSPTPGVTITPRSRSYGTLEKGETAVRSFEVRVPTSHPVGVPVVLNARVTFAGAFSPNTTTFSLEVGRPSDVTVDFAYTGAPVAIPDASTVGASVQIPVSGVGRASKLTFSIDGTTCSTAIGATTVGIDHTYVGDLVGVLTAPSGATAQVFGGAGAGGNNLCQVVFDDAAEAPFSSVGSGDAPFTGTYRPIDPFAGLRGEAVDGAWTFSAFDVARADTGSIRAVSLHINGYVTP